jgi:hypothetical protein
MSFEDACYKNDSEIISRPLNFVIPDRNKAAVKLIFYLSEKSTSFRHYRHFISNKLKRKNRV